MGFFILEDIMENFQKFEYDAHVVRTVEIDGKTWWVAKDICNILGYANNRDAIAKHCGAKGVAKGVADCSVPTDGGNQQMTIIDKANLHRLVAESTLPGAAKFEEWILALNETMTEFQAFYYDGHIVRTVEINGEICWVAKDICDVLELGQVSRATSRLDEDEVTKSNVTDSSGRKQEILVVYESGLYSLILRSNKPEAKKFKRWITHEVLPSIRKTGKYELPIPKRDGIFAQKLSDLLRYSSGNNLHPDEIATLLQLDVSEVERCLALLEEDRGDSESQTNVVYMETIIGELKIFAGYCEWLASRINEMTKKVDEWSRVVRKISGNDCMNYRN